MHAKGNCFDEKTRHVFSMSSPSLLSFASLTNRSIDRSQHKTKTGSTATHVFGQGTTYTYDDVIFLPGFIGFGAHEVRDK